MGKKVDSDLSRRERQIMDAVYKLGKATAAEIQQEIPDPPTNAAVRRLISILEEKGFLRHEEDGQRYVYYPTIAREEAGRQAVRHLTSTFFDGNPVRTVAALIDASAAELNDDELAELSALIEKARQEGR